MSLRSEIARLLAVDVQLQDGRLPGVDLQCRAPAHHSLEGVQLDPWGTGNLSDGFWTFQLSPYALWSIVADAVAKPAGCTSRKLSTRVIHLTLLSFRLAPNLECWPDSLRWLAEPLDPVERHLAVGLERMEASRLAEQTGRQRNQGLRLEPCFHDYYQQTRLASQPLKLWRARWLGRALQALI